MLIKNGTIVNEGITRKGTIVIEGNFISRIILEKDFKDKEEYRAIIGELEKEFVESGEILDAEGLHIMPGVIDDQVHFREPGNIHKATIGSESKAAVLGGVTSYMDMPNNSPAAVTLDAIESKFEIAKESSFANYSFYLGATNSNIDEIKAADKERICGVKVFMGSSTGNMLVDNEGTLDRIFAESPILIATHCEDEETIKANLEHYRKLYNDDIPFEMHPAIRSREACIKCTERAIALALKNSSQLHILHLSTADELKMVEEASKESPKISGEVCVHYMWFNRNDYNKYGSKMKCNPAIKEESDMYTIRKAVKEGIVKVVATDHAPHLKEEKENGYLSAPSGLPLVQHSLQLMLELYRQKVFTLEEIVSRMCHGPANLFNIDRRGYIREGYYADLALIDLKKTDYKSTQAPAYKCGWSPFDEAKFSSSVVHTFVNGAQVVKDGELTGTRKAMELKFNR